MATKPKPDTTPGESGPSPLGGDQVQAAFDEANAKGYFGVKVDPEPNSAHSQESGPDAPSAVTTPNSRVVQHSADTIQEQSK